MPKKLKSPFIYFGGKSRVAKAVWERFGNVANFVEPFFGSGAVMLNNPHDCIETANDLDGYVCNFWRAIQADAEQVAKHADWPVNELDLHARHSFLIQRKREFVELLRADPEYYDAKIAGWWVWGINCWIGDNWCRETPQSARPNCSGLKGIHTCGGLSKQMPHVGDAGKGIHASTAQIYDWFAKLSIRLRRVRVCCGDWSRICGDCVTFGHGLTAVFLDPPYADENRDSVYCEDSFTVAHDVRKWCIENGNNPLLRIALCGYGEHDELAKHGWTPMFWKASGGYGNQNAENKNRHKEVIWFSPHCVGKDLFD